MHYPSDPNAGFYLAWLVTRNHAGERTAGAEAALQARERTGREVLAGDCGGQLDDGCFDGDGNLFTATYYGELFAADARRTFAGDERDPDGAVADSWENHDRLAAVLDQRWRQWEAGQPFAPLVAPPPRASTLELSLAPIDGDAGGPASFAIGAAPPSNEAPRTEVGSAAVQAVLYGAPPLPDLLVERMRGVLSRFLGFEAFNADADAKPLDSKVLYALPLVAEFPGGWHWLELLSVDDRVAGAQPGWGYSLRLQSRPEKAVPAEAVLDAPGWLRSADPAQPGQELFRLPFEEWWEDAASLARTGDGLAYAPVNHPDELDAALETLRTQVQSKLRPRMRQFEMAAVKAARGG